METQIFLEVDSIWILESGGHVIVLMYLCFKYRHLKCLDNQLLLSVQKGIGYLFFIHSFIRLKLIPKCVEDLVFIHKNLRLLSSSSSQYYDEKTKLLDIGGDELGSMEDTSVLQFAGLSLDKSGLELATFNKEPMEKETKDVA